eukprot:UN32173
MGVSIGHTILWYCSLWQIFSPFLIVYCIIKLWVNESLISKMENVNAEKYNNFHICWVGVFYIFYFYFDIKIGYIQYIFSGAGRKLPKICMVWNQIRCIFDFILFLNIIYVYSILNTTDPFILTKYPLNLIRLGLLFLIDSIFCRLVTILVQYHYSIETCDHTTLSTTFEFKDYSFPYGLINNSYFGYFMYIQNIINVYFSIIHWLYPKQIALLYSYGKSDSENDFVLCCISQAGVFS